MLGCAGVAMRLYQAVPVSLAMRLPLLPLTARDMPMMLEAGALTFEAMHDIKVWNVCRMCVECGCMAVQAVFELSHWHTRMCMTSKGQVQQWCRRCHWTPYAQKCSVGLC